MSYDGHLYGVAAEQLQPLYPTAVQVRAWMEDDTEVEANFRKSTTPSAAHDIRHERPYESETIEEPPKVNEIPCIGNPR